MALNRSWSQYSQPTFPVWLFKWLGINPYASQMAYHLDHVVQASKFDAYVQGLHCYKEQQVFPKLVLAKPRHFGNARHDENVIVEPYFLKQQHSFCLHGIHAPTGLITS